MYIEQTERGYAGHFICSHRCTFKRNTLLEYGDVRVVVSTVGNMRLDDKIEPIGCERYFETMAFKAQYDDPYWEADVSNQINFNSDWCISECKHKSDKEADYMHERVVAEIKEKLLSGELK